MVHALVVLAVSARAARMRLLVMLNEETDSPWRMLVYECVCVRVDGGG